MRFCPLYSGSSGNALFVETCGTRLLIDAGLNGRTVEEALHSIGEDARAIDGILITHEHSDHILGAGVLARRYKIPIYANENTWQAMDGGMIGNVPLACVRVFETGRDFFIGEANVLPFPTPHDAAESVGFTIDGDFPLRRLAVMTDIGHVNGRMLDAVDGCDLLLIEANHDVNMLKVGPYPYPLKRRILGDNGHLSNESAGKALVSLYMRGLRAAVLGHLSNENNTECLAYETVRSLLRENDIPDEEFQLGVAHRRQVGMVYEIL